MRSSPCVFAQRTLSPAGPATSAGSATGSSGWQFDTDSTGGPLEAANHQIEGYASATSVNKGNQISFKVSLSSSAQYTMDIYRMGYYPTGTNPDGILYDPATKRIFAFNGRSSNATVIDAGSGKVAGTIAVGGKPEFPVTDQKGNVYVNIEDKSEILQLDPQGLTVKQRWSIAPCEEPSGLAIDLKSRRLFAVCDNKQMAVVDADSGKVVATVPIGEGPDAAAFDPERQVVLSSNGHDGTLTVVKQDGPDKYTVAQTLATEKSARTMTVDSKTHKIYLSAAQLGPAPAATAEHPHPRPAIVPRTFHVIVVSPE